MFCPVTPPIPPTSVPVHTQAGSSTQEEVSPRNGEMENRQREATHDENQSKKNGIKCKIDS